MLSFDSVGLPRNHPPMTKVFIIQSIGEMEYLEQGQICYLGEGLACPPPCPKKGYLRSLRIKRSVEEMLLTLSLRTPVIIFIANTGVLNVLS